MVEWLSQNVGNILITAGLILIVAGIVRHMVRDRKAGRSSCGCEDCGHCAGCALKTAHTGSKKAE